MPTNDCSCCWIDPCREGGAKFDESDMRMMPLPRLEELVARSTMILSERKALALMTVAHDRRDLPASSMTH